MSALPSASPRPRLDPATAMGPVALTVRDREGTAAWYRRVLGLVDVAADGPVTVLGAADGTPLVTLVGDPSARIAARNAPGLYHVAILMPSRGDLGRWLRHTAAVGVRLDGAADHLVSEATYLSDPEGNGVEVYRDRPRHEWPMDGDRLVMSNKQLDLRGILGAGDAVGAAYAGAPAGTTMGHVHLKVADLGATEAFYGGVLGFDLMATYPGALFMSAGGYHHHLGLNVWESAGGVRAPGTTGLRSATVTLPAGELPALADRLAGAGVALEAGADAAAVTDPSGNRLVLVDGPVDAARAVTLAG